MKILDLRLSLTCDTDIELRLNLEVLDRHWVEIESGSVRDVMDVIETLNQSQEM